MKIDFKHRHSAHCESGVSSNLLFHYGVDISEPWPSESEEASFLDIYLL